ncbi:MAG TPA: type II secretion system protein [Elusimicrobiota bacterium]|jgi:general secretion pathway protein G|nr:type II secretion system protein [Elusimicrobiota bacterium]
MPAERKGAPGFSLIELMVVVSIVATLASIAIPKYADMLRKAEEGGAKGNLGSIRSALQIYFSDNQGINPTCTSGPLSNVFSRALVPRYMSAVPTVKTGIHPPVSDVYCDYKMIAGSIHDGQGWYYDGDTPTDSQVGGVWVACDHTDTKGTIWTSY